MDADNLADSPSVDEFQLEASAWLAEHSEPRHESDELSFDTSVFHNRSEAEERQLLEELRSWQMKKAERGYHAITAEVSDGGLALTKEHARAFGRAEARVEVPASHELFDVTTRLIGPTVKVFGTDDQRNEFVPKLLRAELWCCQLFSEPGAGSDLAGIRCRAMQDGESWLVDGQKVWSSGAQFSEWGLLIARTDPDVEKHRGLSAFLVPMSTMGVEVRPIKQMSGGTSFNEVFFSSVRVPDELRVGSPGDGWRVAMTTLGFERDHSSNGSGGKRPGGSWKQLLATAEMVGHRDDPVTRDKLTQLFIHLRIESLVNRRAASLRKAGAPPGPEASIGKLLWTDGMRKMSDVASHILGAALTADSGARGRYEWSEHVLGSPGYRIAGGSDEIQRNVIAERVLGLPREPRDDLGKPWKDIPT